MSRTNVRVKLTGEDGNIFNLVGIARRALRRAGYKEEAAELVEKLPQCQSYTAALALLQEYVEVE